MQTTLEKTRQISLTEREYKLVVEFLEYVKSHTTEPDSYLDGYLNEQTIKSLEDNNREENSYIFNSVEDTFNFLES
ncbi:MAG: hypothetical protein LBQ59_00420 [Candidatus Peribacteria bacterium]|jgi:hypothetical protein|nr:hypothetical protein [Candidatus Peribacteria bacterium]